MLRAANIYKKELEEKFFDAWYDPKYQYYFGMDERWTPWFEQANGSRCFNRSFASVNPEGEVIGYIGFSWDTSLRVASQFGAINFSDDHATFAHDLKSVLHFILDTCKANVLEFAVVCGNPIEPSYDRLCLQYGGRIVGVRTARAMDMAGNLCDDKLYEITQENYQAAKEGRAKHNV